MEKPVLLIGFGIILLQLGTSTPMEQAAFPPYGVFSNSLLGIASFILMLGFINLAYKISFNHKLRKEIKAISLHEFKLIDNLSDSELQEITFKKIAPLIKKFSNEIENEYEFNQPMSNDEMKRYLQEVADEVKKFRNQT